MKLKNFYKSNLIYALISISVLSNISILFLFSDGIIPRVVSDDIYYYITLSENFINGYGIVFNKGSPTNGFHPLYFLVSTGVFYILSPFGVEAPVVGLLIVGVLSHGATGLFLYKISNKLFNWKTGILASGIWLFNPGIIYAIFKGMEANIQVLAISILSYYFILYRDNHNKRTRHSVILGILIALSFHARMDSFFIAVGILISLSLFEVNRYGHITKTIKRIFKRDNLISGISAIIGVLPWVYWSYSRTGRIFPHSSSAQTLIVSATGWGDACPFTDGSYFCGVLNALSGLGIEVIRPFIIPPLAGPIPSILSIGFLIKLVIPVVISVILITSYSIMFVKRYKQFSELDFLMLGGGLFVVYHLFFHFKFRDYYGILLFYISSIVIAQLTMDWTNSRFTDNYNLSTPSSRTLFVGFIVISLLTSVSIAYVSDQQPESNYRTSASYIQEEIPKEATVGAFNAGAMHYYSGRDVINLDGVININSYQSIKNGTLDCYIYNNNITYIVDFRHQVITRLTNPDLTREPVRLEELGDRGFTVFRVKPRNNEVCG